MAKRKRLTPAQPGYLSDSETALESKSTPPPPFPRQRGAPIAQVAGETSSQAALNELAHALETARSKGLMIAELSIDVIDDKHLVRDRLEQDEDEMAALIESLRARGQQTPIEVVPMEQASEGMTHGLISGWRRLTALRRLYEETGAPEFATVKALVVRRETAQDAYVAMVEENEIRVNLSFYERARIAVCALKEGVYPTQKAALQGLFANVTRSKRSKIGSFVVVVEALDSILRYPSAISEKLGLKLAREIGRDPEFVGRLKFELKNGNPNTPAAEAQILSMVVGEGGKQTLKPALETDKKRGSRAQADTVSLREDHTSQITPNLRMTFSSARNHLKLDGGGVTSELMEDLRAWLQGRQ
jgi:ParB family transcriptional regulator, chromosome partitioning protein